MHKQSPKAGPTIRWPVSCSRQNLAPTLTLFMFALAYDTHRRTSAAYKHFNARIIRVSAQGSNLPFFKYVYTCAAGRDGCSRTQRRDDKPTNKLKGQADKCNSKYGDAAPRPKQQDLHETLTVYDKHHHRMLIAMRCAISNRPFISVEDPYYKLEVEHLRSGMYHLQIQPLLPYC